MLAEHDQNLSPLGAATDDLHLCNNYRHLLMSLASIAAEDRPATVVYLEDALPIPEDMRDRLAKACPQATFIFTRDADQIAAFSRLPKFLPSILRRNLSFGGSSGLMRPGTWRPPFLAGKKFAKGYFYHSGFFMSKVAASLCQGVILRESGLNNYTSLQVPVLKSILRWLAGLPPFRQTWGEEAWIDSIEVAHPEELPSIIRGKAKRLTFSDVMDAPSPVLAHKIAGAFLGSYQQTALRPRSALLLTQPISDVGICSLEEQRSVYRNVVTRLIAAGFSVYVKPHPLDSASEYAGTETLPKSFPIEAWPYFSDQKFGVAIALCSASLTSGARAFAEETLQLLRPESFNSGGFLGWATLIEEAIGTVAEQSSL